MAAAQAFTQLLDRGLSAEGSLAAWCPTMDLLALATADGQLHLFRLNWQRLWWQSPDAAITGACDCGCQPSCRQLPAALWLSVLRSRARRSPLPPPGALALFHAAQPWSGAPTASSWRWAWRTARCCC